MSSGKFKTSRPSGDFATAKAASGSFRTASSPHESLERYHCLVVDDERAVLLSVQGLLSDDVDVTTCESAEAALEILAHDSFHIVISDFVLPGMNGNELFRRVRDLPEYTSCLLITGSDNYEQPRGRERHYVLLKPFDPQRLIAMVMQLGRVAQMKRAVHRLASSVSPKAG